MKRINIKKIITGICLFIISFFICGSLDAKELPQIKNYEKYNWEDFLDKNKEYWNSKCDDGDCPKEYLKAQKKFYNRFYKILAKYQKKDLYIEDRVLTEVMFFHLSPGDMNDEMFEYQEEWSPNKSGIKFDDSIIDGDDLDNDTGKATSSDNSYHLGEFGEIFDLDDEDEEDRSMAPHAVKYNNYYDEERDTIKLLVNNMLSIDYHCYKEYGPVLHRVLEDKSVKEYCVNDAGEEVTDGSIVPTQIRRHRRKCAENIPIGEGNHLYYEYYLTSIYDIANRFGFDVANKYIFLGLQYKFPEYNDCMNVSDDHIMSFTYYDNKFKVNYRKFWTFLASTPYFDGKMHLQSFYREVFDKIKEDKNIEVKCMKKDTCDKSLEAAGLYEEYGDEIIKAREDIIYAIMSELSGYLEKDYTEDEIAIILDYGGFMNNLKPVEDIESSRRTYYWPIGSDETEVRNGVLFADGEPASTEIVSYSGERINPATKKKENHTGIDIKGIDGVTNVIAVYSGEVVGVVNNCSVGDYECNDGLGNSITLSHGNGDYTIYGHLSSISVSLGDRVLKGQVIGKVGKTGATLDARLHYELRTGSMDPDSIKDPLEFTDPTNPRPASNSGDFDVHSTTLTKAEFVSKMQAYCNKTKNSQIKTYFCPNLEILYDASISNRLNPEFVVVRGLSEGMSPGGSTYNFWGIGCTNTGGKRACKSYGSLESGIAGLASLGIVSKANTAFDVMSAGYAYIGAYWYNPGSSSVGGCYYQPHIEKFMSASRAQETRNICAGAACSKGNTSSCSRTTSEDQDAYINFQVSKMADNRNKIFDL